MSLADQRRAERMRASPRRPGLRLRPTLEPTRGAA